MNAKTSTSSLIHVFVEDLGDHNLIVSVCVWPKYVCVCVAWAFGVWRGGSEILHFIKIKETTDVDQFFQVLGIFSKITPLP